MYIRSETRRNERKKTFKNKCNTSWWGYYTTGPSFFASFKASKLFSSCFPWTFWGGETVLENPQLTCLVSAFSAIPCSLPANPEQQGHGSHLSPDLSPWSFLAEPRPSHGALWHLLTLWTEFLGTWQVPPRALWPHRLLCGFSPGCFKNQKRILKSQTNPEWKTTELSHAVTTLSKISVNSSVSARQALPLVHGA